MYSRTIPDSTLDLVEPIIVMDELGASVRLLTVQAELQGDDTNPLQGMAILRGLWDSQPMECIFTSDDYCTVLPPINPATLRVKDNRTGATASIQVRALSTELQSTLFGDLFVASLIPLENDIYVLYREKDDVTNEVVAHLLNVPQFNGAPIKGVAGTAAVELPARLRFTGGGWKITIDGLIPWAYQYAFGNYDMHNPKDVKESELWRKRFEALNRFSHTGGTLITHALRVERENGATFGFDRAKKYSADSRHSCRLPSVDEPILFTYTAMMDRTRGNGRYLMRGLRCRLSLPHTVLHLGFRKPAHRRTSVTEPIQV